MIKILAHYGDYVVSSMKSGRIMVSTVAIRASSASARRIVRYLVNTCRLPVDDLSCIEASHMLVMDAVRRGDFEMAKDMAKAGGRLSEAEAAEIIQSGDRGAISFLTNDYPPLKRLTRIPFYAAISGDVALEVLRKFKNEGCLTDYAMVPDYAGRITPLYIASINGFVETVRFLVGVDAVKAMIDHIPEEHVGPALWGALETEQALPAAWVLLEAGANPLCPLRDGRTVLERAKTRYGANLAYQSILRHMEVGHALPYSTSYTVQHTHFLVLHRTLSTRTSD